jgi:outer membrane protein assembly factor BamB
MSLKDEFEVKETPKWGFCASPLVVAGKLIVLPGAPDAGIAALDPENGKILWKTPGIVPGYGSLVVARVKGKNQIVGHDVDSLGGWDPSTGKRLWRIAPKAPNDFNVPTPLPVEDGLIVCTENNGTRLHGFQEDGSIDPRPKASFRQLAPDTHTPVIVGKRLFGVSRRLYCLGVNDLQPLGEATDPAFGRYCAIVASKDRVLVISLDGELRLFSAGGDLGRPIAKAQIFPGEKGLYSHPAIVGTRIYARGSSQLACFDLGEPG